MPGSGSCMFLVHSQGVFSEESSLRISFSYILYYMNVPEEISSDGIQGQLFLGMLGDVLSLETLAWTWLDVTSKVLRLPLRKAAETLLDFGELAPTGDKLLFLSDPER